MGQIKDTNKYPYDLVISKEDYLIGSDADNNGQTRNYSLMALANFFAQYINSTSDSTYFHEQEIASSQWTIPHNMGKRPTPLILDETGATMLADVSYPSLDVMIINFGRPFAGTATLN